MKFRIWWWVKTTGYVGHGFPLEHSDASAWRDKGNREHPDIIHWVLPA